MRAKLAIGIIEAMQLVKGLVGWAIFIGVAVGVYWPLAKVIWHNPLNALWAIPAGFIIGGISLVLQSVIAGILFIPISAVMVSIAWLLSKDAVTLHRYGID